MKNYLIELTSDIATLKEIKKIFETFSLSFRILELVEGSLEENGEESGPKDTYSIEVPIETYHKIADLCKIMNWPPGQKITQILECAAFSAEIEDIGPFKMVHNF